MSDNGRQRIDKELERLLAEYGIIVSTTAVKEYALHGPGYDINAAYNRSDYLSKTSNITIGGMVDSTTMGLTAAYSLTKEIELHDFWMNRKHDGFTLSERLRFNASNARQVVKSTLDSHIKSKTTWMRITKDLTAQKVSIGDLPNYLKDLHHATKNYFLGNFPTGAQLKEFNSAMKKAERSIKRLVDSKGTTSQLKSAYNQALKAAKKGDIELLNKKMDVAVQRKAIYNNERIARTETARAYGESIARRSADMGADYIIWTLSSAHKVPDECDVYANANAFGLGKGVWPVNAAPPYPAHPVCRCIPEPTVKGVGDKRKARYSEERVNESIKDLPKYKQRLIVGVDGRLNTEDVKGYGQPKKMSPLPKKFVKIK